MTKASTRSKNKARADLVMAQQGLVASQDQGQRLIMAGQVLMVDQKHKRLITKPGEQIARDAILEIKTTQTFVSRGGHKLWSALQNLPLDVTGLVALDAGASTGGFTDCLLQSGARRVYAVDVGYGLLHWKLVQDARVINMQRINLRYAPTDLLPEPVDLITVDCSFISLRLILPSCLPFLQQHGQILALVKPQFELEAEHNIKGVVHCPILQMQAVQNIQDFAQQQLHLTTLGLVPAGLKGPKGNQEYFLHFKL